MSDTTIDADPETGTALATIRTSLPTLIAADKDDLLGKLKAEIDGFEADTSTKKGRDAIKAMAFKPRKAKAAFEKLAESLTEDAKKTIKATGAELKTMKELLDGLSNDIRRPLDEIEAAEAAIERDNEAAITTLENLAIGLDELTADEIKQRYLTSRQPFPWAPTFAMRADRVTKGIIAQLQVAHQAATERAAQAAAEVIRQAEETERQRLAAVEAQNARDAAIAAEATRLAEIEAARQAQEAEQAAQQALQAQAEQTRKAEELAERLRNQAESNRVMAHRNALAVMERLATAKTGNEATIMVDTDLATLAHTWDRDWQEFHDEAKVLYAHVESTLMQRHKAARARDAQADAAREEAQRVRDEAEKTMAEAKARQDLADQKVAEEAAAAKRARNVAHQKQINGEIVEDIVRLMADTYPGNFDEAKITAGEIMKALVKKEIRHVGNVQY